MIECEDEEEDLRSECHPSRTDERVVWDDEEIAHEIDDGDTRVDHEHLLLSPLRDEHISRE